MPPKEPVHEDWNFCTRCFYEQWDNPLKPTNSHTVVNLYPFATNLRKWLLREPVKLPLILPKDFSLSNPFSHHTSCLVLIFTDVVNDFAAFLQNRNVDLIEPWQIDLKRMHLASEMILYTVRICEALFKQMLYCTQFDFKRYWHKSLGKLLEQRCYACKGKRKHTVSLAGSLAHRYKLCGQYEQCLKKDLNYLNKLRNTQAAHATVGQINMSPTLEEAWRVANWHCNEIGNKFIHMLKHISEIELAMIKEVKRRLMAEDCTGHYNSSLASTFYWEKSFRRFYNLLLRQSQRKDCNT